MAITFVSASATESVTSWESSWTWSFSVNPGNDRILVLALQPIQGGMTFSSVTYGGNACTFFADNTAVAYGYRAFLYYMISPPVGTANVIATAADVCEGFVGSALGFTGVNQVTPWGNWEDGYGTTSPGEVTVASAVGEMVVSSIQIYGGSGTPLVDYAGQTSRTKVFCDVANATGASSTKDGAASVTIGYTFYDYWGMVIGALKPGASRRRIIIT